MRDDQLHARVGDRRRAIGRCLVLALALATQAGPALAQEPAADGTAPVGDEVTREQCFENHEAAQVELRKGKLLSARSSLLVCSRAQCPPLVRSDCLEWYADVERSTPSVVFSARRGQKDLFDVKVTVDGKVLTEALDGRAHELDPGKHHFRVESPGLEPLERDVLVSRGEKGRLLSFEFPAEEGEKTASAAAATTPGPALPTHRPVPTLTYVLGGVALGAVAVGVVVGYLGKSERDDLAAEPANGGCSPYCSSDEVSAVKTKLITADILFGVGAVTGTVALFTYLLRPEVPIASEQSKVSLSLAAGPGSVALGGRF
jgi:hypothetical protein